MLNSALIKNFFSVDGLDNSIVFDAPAYSGLANQLRGLTSAIIMAEEKGRNFFLNWGKMEDMSGINSLSELFEYPELNYTSVGPHSINSLQRYFCFFENRNLLAFPDWLKCQLITHHQFNNLLCDMIANNVSFLFPTIIIRTYYSFHAEPIAGIDFYDMRHRLYKRFVPVREIRKTYQNFIEQHFSDYTIGVHIRTKNSMRTPTEADRKPADPKRQIRFDLFFSEIDQTIERNPHSKIFLATDNIEECGGFWERYGKRIIMHPKNTINGMVRRFTAEDHRDALVDLLLLANTQKLIGTKQSTFSYEAAIMGNVPFVEVSESGLRQKYNLIDDKTVTIDFRDNGIGAFEKEMTYDKKGKERTSFNVVDVQGKKIVDFFYNELKKTDRPVVFDVGASTGCFSLVAKFIESSTFYSFEPHELLFDVLKSNLKLNNVENRVKSFNIGLLNEAGERILNVPKSGQYILSTYGQEPKFGNFRSVVSSVDTLDRFVERQNIRKIDLLKINAGGAGYDILKGGKAALRRCRPNILLQVRDTDMSQFGYNKKMVFDLLESLEYRYQFISPEHVHCMPGK